MNGSELYVALDEEYISPNEFKDVYEQASRTRAHVFTIMLAYLIAYELRRLWQDIEVTIEEGIEELSSLCATEAIIGNVSIQTVPEPRERGKLLLELSIYNDSLNHKCGRSTFFPNINAIDISRIYALTP